MRQPTLFDTVTPKLNDSARPLGDTRTGWIVAILPNPQALPLKWDMAFPWPKNAAKPSRYGCYEHDDGRPVTEPIYRVYGVSWWGDFIAAELEIIPN